MIDDSSLNGEFIDSEYGSVASGTSAPSVHYINEAGLEESIFDQVKANREIASVIEKWSQSLSSTMNTPSLDVFNRNKWNGANHTFAQISECCWAVENDDILSTSGDVMESLAFQKCRFELFDRDQQDLWNQWAANINLDDRLRALFRELYKASQVYVGLWWEKAEYSVRENEIDDTLKEFEGQRLQRDYEDQVRRREAFIIANPDLPPPPSLAPPPDGRPGRGNRRRKRRMSVTIPTEMTIFDPTKVMPVGTLMFGRERFAYVADRGEDDAFSQVMGGDIADGTVLKLIERKYAPTNQDRAACAEVGVDPDRLWLFREEAIFRHAFTKSDYERFAAVRLKSVLPLLEMKQHLRASDRSSLIGNTNFIVVITKGSDRHPALPAEIANLQEQARVIARLPVLIGDHRLHVEIVSPALDNTLMESRWQALDSRLVYKALQSFMPIVQGGNASTGVSEMSRVVARGLESRRHMLVRSLEKEIFKRVLDRNQSVLDERPSLAFTPKRITLDFKADVLQQILKLRDRGDISRETTLEEMDYDQEVEVLRRARERGAYDQVFESQTPHSSPVSNPYAPTPPQSNVGPAGQPRTEGGRPPGVTETQPREPQ